MRHSRTPRMHHETPPGEHVPSPQFGDRLVAERERTRAQLADLTRDFDAIVESAQGAPPDDEHDPDGATIGFERAQTTALIDMARARLVELDAALDRIADGTYGTCAVCGAAITGPRLEAMPTARTCIRCASRRR